MLFPVTNKQSSPKAYDKVPFSSCIHSLEGRDLATEDTSNFLISPHLFPALALGESPRPLLRHPSAGTHSSVEYH